MFIHTCKCIKWNWNSPHIAHINMYVSIFKRIIIKDTFITLQFI